MKYALITPARNEEANLARLIGSMVMQTQKPEAWIIVDDGSSDRTPEVADEAARKNRWIQVVHRPIQLDRSFAGKVRAFNEGYAKARALDYDVIGNLDADVSFEADYMHFLMGKFAADPKLGVAGTPFTQDGGYDSARDSFEGENYVSGGCQLFRKECFEEIDGYVPHRAGGIDWIAVMKARMKGWTVRCFPEKRYHHYRFLGTAGKSTFRSYLDYGERAYYLGWSPLWHVLRVVYRFPKNPVGSLGLLFGFCSAWMRRVQRPVSPEMVRFHRNEQLKRLKTLFGAMLRFERVDSFRN
jgi:glycosyltransferase involved in cell wall biosynthesis